MDNKQLVLTVGVHVLAQLRLGLPVGPVGGLVGESGRHGGGCGDGLEGALPLLHVEFWVEDDDVDFGHVEHAEGHGGAQVHGDGQGGGLDVELRGRKETKVRRLCFGTVVKNRMGSITWPPTLWPPGLFFIGGRRSTSPDAEISGPAH